MRKKIIVGNWKMHLNTHEASLLVQRLGERIQAHDGIEVVLAPSLISLQPISLELDRHKFKLAAQNAFYKDEGAYTGEVSFTMLRNLVEYALIGHSERRIKFGETLEIVRDKVQAAVRNGIMPVLCIGETQSERNAGETKQVLHDQLTSAVSNLTSEDIHNVVVAYEPVWAISSGTDYANHAIAKPDDVEKIVNYIRHEITELYGKKAADDVRVIYGGSSNAENARAYLETPGVDGLLPGGASLNYEQFSDIVNTAHKVNMESKKKAKK